MTVSAGSHLGPYKVLSPLGAGGMGEVWRARDTKLNRDVAIKTLPAEFAGEEERLARFEREARLLAALNHPNVAAIYGFEVFDGAPHLVLECVEGETLAERLAAGALPVSEALSVCRQIALALEAAHETGIIHRDLKPGNVKIRPDGSIKVLDFGLAKFVESEPERRDVSQSPTITTGGTRTGMILGTAAYMSPEQARGRPLDKRADIFSFGCVLYECLAGRLAFHGEFVSDTLAAILKTEPDWRELPPETPGKVRDLLRRCLEKTRERRLHDIADARLEIEEALAAPAEAAPVSADAAEIAGRSAITPRLLWGLAGLLLGVLAATAFWRLVNPAAAGDRSAPVRSTLPLPPDTRLTISHLRPSLAFSPDGGKLVFRATDGGVSRLYIRALDRPEAVPIAGTEGAFNPFFSPDGEWLGFFAPHELKKVSLAGGLPVTIATVPPVTEGGTWSPDGSILFTWAVNSGVYRIASSGGKAEPLATPDQSRGERALAWPQMLPDGKNVLMLARVGKDFQEVANSNVVVQSLESGKRKTLVSNAVFARYVPPGYLLFARGTTVLAARCDPKRWELTGPAVPVLENVLTGTSDGAPFAAASGTGLLIYATGGKTAVATDSVLWVDRAGREEPLPTPPRVFGSPTLSPDNKRLAIQAREAGEEFRMGIAIYDFDRKVLSPLTTGPGRFFCPVWSPDGKRLAFSRFLIGNPQACWKAADGSGEIEPLTPGGRAEFPTSWSPDGKLLAYATGVGGLENVDIWTLSLDGKRELRPYLATPFREFAPFFSPDGRWIAYNSDESGRNEIYVRPYPGPGGQTKISNDGGIEPAWSPNGGEIFYRSAKEFMAVPVRTSPDFSAGEARPLFADRYVRWGREDGPRYYDVSSDGSRFLVIKRGEVKQPPVTQLNLLSNWTAELPRAGDAKR